jgi:hypothetical protein
VKLRHFALSAVVAIAAGFSPHSAPSPTSYALIVGISDYANFGAEVGGDLPGARNDALAYRDVFIAQKGFAPENIHMLLDGEATRVAIVRELKEWLPSVVKRGDLVVFAFAGHGSQAWDTNGDEEDGLDETICPTDVTKGMSAKDITDDELNQLLRGIPTDNIVVVMDNCHAGSGTRAVTPFARPRSLARNATADVAKPANATAGQPVTNAAADAAPASVLEIAAAQAGEVAVDAEWISQGGVSIHGGAFTRNFVRNIWQSPAASYEEIFQQTVEDMKRERFAQRPNLDAGLLKAKAEQPAFTAFGVKAGDTDASVPVIAISGANVVLGGGAAAGMTVGSTYRSGTATLRITTVEGNKAVASAIGGTVKAGDRARLVAFVAPEPTLRVSVAAVAATTRSALAAQVKTAGVTFVSGGREFAHLLVRPKDDYYIIIGLDGATRHTAKTLNELATLITQEAGAHQLAVLDNPAHPFGFEFGFKNNQKNFKEGDEIVFRARAARDGYLTIVDLGTDGKVTVIYPSEAGQDSRIKAGAEFTLPDGDVKFEAQLPAGRGIVRAFVTDKPLELKLSGGMPTEAALVGRALRKAIGATSSALPVTNWATSSIVYSISK